MRPGRKTDDTVQSAVLLLASKKILVYWNSQLQNKQTNTQTKKTHNPEHIKAVILWFSEHNFSLEYLALRISHFIQTVLNLFQQRL